MKAKFGINRYRLFLLFIIAVSQFIYSPLKADPPCAGCGGLECDWFGGGCGPCCIGPCSSCFGTQEGFTTFIPVLEIGAAFGDTVGVDSDYATIGTQMYTTFGPNSAGAFISTFKAHLLNDHGSINWAANIGFGYRTYEWYTKATKGIHVFLDARESNRHSYHGFGLSLEYLSKYYSIRINGYYPVGKISKTTNHKTFEFEGGFVERCSNKLVALKGADIDLEFPIVSCKDWSISAIGGAYYFNNDHISTELGGLAIARVSWRDILVIEGRYTYDKNFGSRGQGVIIFNIPLTGWCAKYCQDYTRQFVRRFDIMPLDSTCRWCQNF